MAWSASCWPRPSWACCRARRPAPPLLLADLAFGLILFELGYRINLRWLRTNPWIGVSSLAEAGAPSPPCTMAPAPLVRRAADQLRPAGRAGDGDLAGHLVRVINEQKSRRPGDGTRHAPVRAELRAGRVRLQPIVGLWMFRTFEDVGDARRTACWCWPSPAFSGAVFGRRVPAVLRSWASWPRMPPSPSRWR
jgi:hypothetical protein